MSFGQWALGMLIIGVCMFLMLVILLQRGRGAGISGAFGGGGGSGAFGAKTGDVFTWITVVVTGLFFVLAVVANFAFDQSAVAVAQPASVAPVEVPTSGEPGTPPGQPGTIQIPVTARDAGGTIELIGPDGKPISGGVTIVPSGPSGATEGKAAGAPTQPQGEAKPADAPDAAKEPKKEDKPEGGSGPG
ncbi:MAG: preprotein translocase subunit SecG [Planctomycetota bacterium]